MSKAKEKRITMIELRHARMVVENLHAKLREGYGVEGDGIVDVINAMMNLLHDVVTTAEKHNVAVDGSKVVGKSGL